MAKAAPELEELISNASLIDDLAAIEHERWSHWQKYLHEQCECGKDGSLRIPRHLVARWSQQMATDFADLSADEQQSDREQALRYLPAILAAVQKHLDDRDSG